MVALLEESHLFLHPIQREPLVRSAAAVWQLSLAGELCPGLSLS